MNLKILMDPRLHVLVIVLSLISEYVGIIKVPLGPGTLLLLPLFYAFILALLFNPFLNKPIGKLLPREVSAGASPLIILAVMPFIARFGTTIGPAIDQIIHAGFAFLLQELGNLGTVFIALPFAVLVLKMGRETIGATFSIAREPNIAIISDVYGLKGPEGIGVMGVYIIGTLFGTLWFALLASFTLSLDIFDPRALAMACGVGSGSMVAACSGALANMLPEMGDSLIAFGGASNLLTYATGLYVSLFIALPAAEWMYKVLHRFRRTSAAGAGAGGALAEFTDDAEEKAGEVDPAERPENHLLSTAWLMALVCAVGWISNTVNGGSLIDALPGMVLLYIMTMIGLAITRIMPFYLPGVAWVSLVSILMTLPWFPGSAWMLEQLRSVDFLAIVTPVLAYAGFALGTREFQMFRTTGWKLLITALLVFTGTFLGSAIVAEIML